MLGILLEKLGFAKEENSQIKYVVDNIETVENSLEIINKLEL